MDHEDRYVAVALPVPLRHTFDYRVPPSLTVAIGRRVRVRFGKRLLTGIVTGTDTTPDIEPSKIRDILETFDVSGDVHADILALCLWAADYYQHPVGEVIAAALPTAVRQGWNPREPVTRLVITDAGRAADPGYLARAPAQHRALAALTATPQSRARLGEAGVQPAIVRTLIDKGWIAEQETAMPPPAPFSLRDVHHSGITTTSEQTQIISSLINETKGPHKPCLIQGVTGSGKTEIYLQVIEHHLRAGRQALVLVPEIGLTPQTIDRFKARFDTEITVLHSSLTDSERANGWIAAATGSTGIVLGTRSAVFTPLKNPGVIVIDEEHDASYKQQDGFRYSARDLAVLRGQFSKLPVLLGSATPSLESLHNVDTGKYVLQELTERIPGAPRETYELIDTRHLEVVDGFTRGLKQKIRERLNDGEQVLVFLNRRGFAPVLLCNTCNWIADCRRCDSKLTYHLNLKALVCHHCGSTSHNILSCQSCGGSDISAVGLGTQRIEQSLAALFPEFPVLRIDRDSTRKKGAMSSFIAEVNRGKPAILIGTQLLAKGHHFPGVTLVALLDVDAGFYSTDFRALERLGQLILQVGGRAGRESRQGVVCIQTAFADHPLFQQLIHEGYSAFSRTLLKERELSELPPYSYQALLRAESHNPSMPVKFLEAVEKAAAPLTSANLLGPIPAVMEKKAGRFRQLLIVTANRRSEVHAALAHCIVAAEAEPLARKVRWTIDVDPLDLY